MRISLKTTYALRMLLDLALNRDKPVVRLSDVCRRQGIPEKFLEQIVLILKRGGLVGSRRGPRGGYFLTLSPSRISLAQVVRLTDGSLLKDDSVGDVFDSVWTDLRSRIREELESITLEQLVDRALQSSTDGANEYVI